MQFIHKFTLENTSHRQIYFRKFKTSIHLLQEIQVIDKFISENASHRQNLFQKIQVIYKFTTKNASHRQITSNILKLTIKMQVIDKFKENTSQ